MEATQNNPVKSLNTNIITSIQAKFQAIGQKLLQPTDVSALAAFRVLFGALMVWEVYRYHQYDRIARYYIEPKFFFPYEFFPFLSPLPGHWMYLVFFVMGLSALGIALGFFYRLSAALFFVSYTYVFLLDKAQYNNHYYMISLVSFLLICVDAHRWASIDQKLRPTLAEEFVPFWQFLILRAQFFLVYFFGGVAKINSDWLQGEPMRDWLQNRSDYPLAGPFFTTEAGVYFFSYGGLCFDLLVGTLLIWRRTRLLAFLGVLFFNLTNKWLFSIGIFPYAMIAATILFVEADWPRRILRRAKAAIPPAITSIARRRLAFHTWTLAFVTLYLALQLAIPLRHWLYPGNVSWTEQGHRFSWHMKLRSKSAKIAFTVTDPKTNQSWQIDPREDLNSRQLSKMATRPDMIIYYVHHLKEKVELSGIQGPIIQVYAWASLNGRPYQQLVDPNANLAAEPWNILARSDWILPLQIDLFAEDDFLTLEEDDE
jgi:hypothetical protein